MGKTDTKKLHVREGDIAGNSFEDNTDITIDTSFTYDLEGNLKTTIGDNVYTSTDTTDTHTITYLYDNMGRKTGTEELVITEDGTEKRLTVESELNWQGNPITTEIKVDGVTTRFESYEIMRMDSLRQLLILCLRQRQGQHYIHMTERAEKFAKFCRKIMLPVQT